MAIGDDLTYSGQSKIYQKQQPESVTINGNTVTTEEVVAAGGLLNTTGGLTAYKSKILPAIVSFAIAAGAANHSVITITIQDNGAQAITGTPFDLDVILSDLATGVGVTATAPSTSLTVTTGTQLNSYVTNKALYVQSDTNGIIVINIFDTAKTGYFVMVQGGQIPIPYISRQLVAGDYG